MKNSMNYIVFLILMTGSTIVSAQNGQDLGEVISEYMDVKKALVQDDSGVVKQEIPDLKRALANLAIESQQHSKLVEAVDKLARANEINAERRAFAELSNLLLPVVKRLDLDQVVYVQSCPMALKGEGAIWLSLEEQVQNPYMGQRMPKCGAVKETI